MQAFGYLQHDFVYYEPTKVKTAFVTGFRVDHQGDWTKYALLRDTSLPEGQKDFEIPGEHCSLATKGPNWELKDLEKHLTD